MCISHFIYTVRPCLIHTCHAMPMPCSDHAVLLKATEGRRETAVLSYGLENNGMVGAWHGHGMESVNQTRPHCVNQMGKTHSKPLPARHGRGTAWARHGNGMLWVNRPWVSHAHMAVAASDVIRRFAVATGGMAWGWINRWSWSIQYSVAQSRDITPICDFKEWML